MSTFISMLRGINVSGQKQVRMEDLRGAYTALGLEDARTYVQSGNVVFESAEKDASVLAKHIEAQIGQTFGFSTPVLIREVGDFARILAGNPFLNGRNEDPARLYVTFLYERSLQRKSTPIEIPRGESDVFVLGEREVYLFCPNGYGRTKLNNTFFEKKLHVPATTRNWNTVKALYKMAAEGR